MSFTQGLYLFSILAYAIAVPPLPECITGCNKFIVGGEPIEERGVIPWQVSWRWGRGQSHFCGGSIIDKNWILSAGHCCAAIKRRNNNGVVVVGSIDLRSRDGIDEFRTVSDAIIYDHYNPSNINGDICLLYIDQPFNFNEKVKPVQLDTNLDWPRMTEFSVSGWGSLQAGGPISRFLQQVKVPHVTSQECNIDYANIGGITQGMICAGKKGKDSCQGDSGGPMVGRNDKGENVLVGVVSWGIGCAEEGHPGVYARVAYFIEWIQETMALKL